MSSILPLIFPPPHAVRLHSGVVPNSVVQALTDALASGTTNPLLSATDDPELAPEGYRLQLTSSGVDIAFRDAQGRRWAEDTLLQLLRSGGIVHETDIEDAPLYGWRGLMLDVARQFFTVDEVLSYLDTMALFRFNRLHLHLSDDQGWRFEVAGYPRLTEIGAFRPRLDYSNYTDIDILKLRALDASVAGSTSNGFYSRTELRRIVEHARALGIIVVPEVDLPGHMQAAILSYPELGNPRLRKVPVADWTFDDGLLWPSDESARFIQAVIAELAGVFDAEVIHVGGDECPFGEWLGSDIVQEWMTLQGLTTGEQVQGWFTQVIADALDDHSRRLAGWDEIVHTQPDPRALVFAWRHDEAVSWAMDQGFEVVVCSQEHLYFDYYQGDPSTEPLAISSRTDLEDVWDFEPGSKFGGAHTAQILGVQGQLWTEFITTFSQLQYMTYPRALALAERAWGSPKDNFASFLDRAAAQLALLAERGVNARPLDGY